MNAVVNSVVNIIPRKDASSGAPVVFLRDTLNREAGTIQAWNGQGNPQLAPLAWYESTKPLSAQDDEIMRQRYSAAFPGAVVLIHQRLPRTSKALPSILNGNNANIPTMAPTQAPQITTLPMQGAAIPPVSGSSSNLSGTPMQQQQQQDAPKKRGRAPASPEQKAELDAAWMRYRQECDGIKLKYATIAAANKQ